MFPHGGLPCPALQVRPLGQVGKLQLAKDMGELQMAVGASLFPLEQLGQPYRCVCMGWGYGGGVLYGGATL